MRAKLTTRNRLTLPKAALEGFPGVRYFDVRAEPARIVLRPIRGVSIERIMRKLERLNLGEQDVVDAVRWARQRT